MFLVAERLKKLIIREIPGGPPESVMFLFHGEPFGVDHSVVVLVIYGLCVTTSAHQALVEEFGVSQLTLLADFAKELRKAGYELLITGDLYGYIKSVVGFDGDSAIFGDHALPEDLHRLSNCKHQHLMLTGTLFSDFASRRTLLHYMAYS